MIDKQIAEALGIDAKGDASDAVAAIKAIKASLPDAKLEALIAAKMAAGLSRDTAIEAINNQKAEDARKASASCK